MGITKVSEKPWDGRPCACRDRECACVADPNSCGPYLVRCVECGGGYCESCNPSQELLEAARRGVEHSIQIDHVSFVAALKCDGCQAPMAARDRSSWRCENTDCIRCGLRTSVPGIFPVLAVSRTALSEPCDHKAKYCACPDARTCRSCGRPVCDECHGVTTTDASREGGQTSPSASVVRTCSECPFLNREYEDDDGVEVWACYGGGGDGNQIDMTWEQMENGRDPDCPRSGGVLLWPCASLPEGVDRRLQSLLDKQEAGDELIEDEQAEADGLVELSELLTLLRLRASRSTP